MLEPTALQELGFDRLLQALADRAQTSLGRERCLALPQLADRAAADLHLAEVEEARRLLRGGARPVFGGLIDLSAVLARAEKQGTLEGSALREVAAFARGSVRLRGYLEDRASLAPNFAARSESFSEFAGLASALEEALEPSGRVADGASPVLRSLRERVAALHRQLRDRLDALLKDEQFLINLREGYLTIRNGRYCVPVLAQARAQVPGIVHNSSQTGQTLFVEPQPLIHAGNDLAIAESMAAEEELRILAQLTQRVSRWSAELHSTAAAVAEVDEIFSGAELSELLHSATPAVVGGDQPFALFGLRHPLLALRLPDQVIASDVVLTGAARALVVSGPNAGGKTVMLTAIGLCVGMVRVGLPIPAEARSRVPWIDSLFCAIGDDQDLAKGLSTFSAHLAALRRILSEAAAGALVLIDEIAADTDPREGAALATAVLEHLVERGSLAVVTTHLDPLKALAFGDGRFLNAAVGYDVEQQRPTYRLELGEVGSSSALALASRAGLPATLVQRARDLLAVEAGPLGQALRALEEQRAQSAAAATLLAAQLAELAQLRRQLSEGLAQAEARERAAERAAREEVLAELGALRAEAAEVLQSLRAAPTVGAATRSQARLTELQASQQQALESPPAAASGFTLLPGQRVRSRSLGLEGDLLTVEGEDGLVAIGALKTRRSLSDLEPARKEPSKQKQRRSGIAADLSDRAVAVAAAPLTLAADLLDLRGLRAEDAVREAERFLDGAFANARPQVKLLHGLGSGALRASLRALLHESRYVRSFRAGAQAEGGEGATVVDLAI